MRKRATRFSKPGSKPTCIKSNSVMTFMTTACKHCWPIDNNTLRAPGSHRLESKMETQSHSVCGNTTTVNPRVTEIKPLDVQF